MWRRNACGIANEEKSANKYEEGTAPEGTSKHILSPGINQALINLDHITGRIPHKSFNQLSSGLDDCRWQLMALGADYQQILACRLNIYIS
jgi:hypothetical protein